MKKSTKFYKRGLVMILAFLMAFSIAACTSTKDSLQSASPGNSHQGIAETGMKGLDAATPAASPDASPSASPSASPTASPSTSPTVSPSASPAAVMKPAPTSTPKAAAEATKAPNQTQYPLKLKDDTGTVVIFDKAPMRVTTIASSETEAVFAIGAGDKIFGVDQYSNYPDAAKSKPQVGDMNTNLEALLATKPDVVFANNGLQSKVIDKLRELNIKVYASNPKTIDEIITKIETVGQIMNLQENALKVTSTMRSEKNSVVNALNNAPKKKVYLEFDPGWTVGDGEFLSDLINLAGGINVAGGKNGWYQIDPEAIIKANPQVILYAKETYGQGSILDIMNKRAGWDIIDAMKNKQVFALETDPLVRVGPRITKGLIEMAKAIHPDLVK
jgi:iron complex transport system substrate-binding protein